MLLFCDSFDHYATADILKKWTYREAGGSSTNVISAVGRNSTNGVTLHPGSSTHGFTKDLGGNYNSLVVGFAMKVVQVNSNSIFPFVKLLDEATNHVDVRMNAAGVVLVTRNAVVLETTALILLAGVWYFFEIKSKIDDGTSGTWEVRVNGVQIAKDVGGGDTRNGANNYVNRVGMYAAGQYNDTIFDDYYICSTSGSFNNDFLGDVRVVAQFPSADGSNVGWAANGAASDRECVDEVAPNDDTDYISSLTPGALESFSFPALAVTGPIKAIQVLLEARKDDAGSRSIREYCLSGGSVATGPTQSLSDSYLYYSKIRETDPHVVPDTLWTKAGLDAAEEGCELVA